MCRHTHQDQHAQHGKPGYSMKRAPPNTGDLDHGRYYWRLVWVAPDRPGNWQGYRGADRRLLQLPGQDPARLLWPPLCGATHVSVKFKPNLLYCWHESGMLTHSSAALLCKCLAAEYVIGVSGWVCAQLC